MDDKTVIFTAPAAKVGAAVGTAAAVNADKISDAAIGVATHPMLQMTWNNVAAVMATIVSLCVLADWFWKRFWKPLSIRRGWIKVPDRRVLTEKEVKILEAFRSVNDSERLTIL